MLASSSFWVWIPTPLNSPWGVLLNSSRSDGQLPPVWGASSAKAASAKSLQSTSSGSRTLVLFLDFLVLLVLILRRVFALLLILVLVVIVLDQGLDLVALLRVGLLEGLEGVRGVEGEEPDPAGDGLEPLLPCGVGGLDGG